MSCVIRWMDCGCLLRSFGDGSCVFMHTTCALAPSMPLAYYLMEDSDGAVLAAMDALTVGQELLCDEEYLQLEQEMMTFLEKVCPAMGLEVSLHGSLCKNKHSCDGSPSLAPSLSLCIGCPRTTPLCRERP